MKISVLPQCDFFPSVKCNVLLVTDYCKGIEFHASLRDSRCRLNIPGMNGLQYDSAPRLSSFKSDTYRNTLAP